MNEAIQDLSGEVTDVEMQNVAQTIDDVRDVMMSLMPRLHNTLVKKTCQACMINDPSQNHHTCFEHPDNEEKVAIIEECMTMIDDALINMIYMANGKPTPTVEVDSVKAITQAFVIEEFQKRHIGTVASEEMG